MNFVSVLAFTCTCTALLFVQSYGSIRDNPSLNAWFKECQEKTNASDEDYGLIKIRKMPETVEGMCMVECLFNKLHIIEHGKFNQRGFVITFSPVTKGDLRKLSKLKEIAVACDQKVTAAEFRKDCDTTRIVLECFSDNMDKFDMKS